MIPVWTEWEKSYLLHCSVTCGNGTAARLYKRRCNIPFDAPIDTKCHGAAVKFQRESCTLGQCTGSNIKLDVLYSTVKVLEYYCLSI